MTLTFSVSVGETTHQSTTNLGEYLRDNILTQVMGKQKKGGTLLDLARKEKHAR